MNGESIRIIDVKDIPTGGFAGIVETRMVMNPTFWPKAKSDKKISHGLDDFIYLANGYFKPNDGAPIHPHKDVDIVSFITSGSVGHKGSLGNGTVIHGPGVQVQRSGKGMQHSEFSINNEKAGIIQIWFMPPENNLTPEYQNFKLKEGKLTTVLGGTKGNTFNSNMTCQIGFIDNGKVTEINKPFVALITRGTALANGISVHEGQLIEGSKLTLTAQKQLGLVLITRGDN